MGPESELHISGELSSWGGLPAVDLRNLSPVMRYVTLLEGTLTVRERLSAAVTLTDFMAEFARARFTPDQRAIVNDAITSQRARSELESLVDEPSVVSSPPLTIGQWRSLVEGINKWAPKGLEDFQYKKRSSNSDRHPFVDEVFTWITNQLRQELYLWSIPDHTKAGWMVAAVRIQAPPENEMEQILARKTLSLAALSAFSHGYNDDAPRSAINLFVRPWLDHFLFEQKDTGEVDLVKLGGTAKSLIELGAIPTKVVDRLREVRRGIIEKIDSISPIEEPTRHTSIPQVEFKGIGESLDISKKADDFVKRLFEKCKPLLSSERAMIFSILEKSNDLLAEYPSSRRIVTFERENHKAKALCEIWKWAETEGIKLSEFPYDSVVTGRRTGRKDREDFANKLRDNVDILLKLESRENIREGVDLICHYIRAKAIIPPVSETQS